MRVVNLSRRPFINRRPVVRLAAVLWVLGGLLLAYNVWLYVSHWRGTATNRARLVALNRDIEREAAKLGAYDPDLARVNLARQNARVQFLNRLIDYRTFPWSALFEDLEEVVPLDVRLLSVQPEVQMVAEEVRRREPRRRTTGRRSRTAETPAAPAPAPVETDGDDLRQDEVELRLSGVAKTEEALMAFLQTLYESPSFRRPILPGENLDEGQGSIRFNINTVYLTRRNTPDPDPEVPVVESAASEPPAVEEVAVEPEPAALSSAIDAPDEEPDFDHPDASASPRLRSGAALPTGPSGDPIHDFGIWEATRA